MSYLFALLVNRPISEYTAPIMSRINTKLIRVSLTECDLLSISWNEYTAKASPAKNIIHPAIPDGKKNIPYLLNQGNLIFVIV
jgi:hypothetical protein